MEGQRLPEEHELSGADRVLPGRQRDQRPDVPEEAGRADSQAGQLLLQVRADGDQPRQDHHGRRHRRRRSHGELSQNNSEIIRVIKTP